MRLYVAADGNFGGAEVVFIEVDEHAGAVLLELTDEERWNVAKSLHDGKVDDPEFDFYSALAANNL